MTLSAKFINIIVIIIFTTCLGGLAVVADDKIYIDKGKVGNIATGMDVSSLIKKYPERFSKTFVQRESEESPAFIYTFNNGKPITIEVNNGSIVWYISVEDPYFKTRKGIGVGNTFKDVKKAYPNAKFIASEVEGEHIGLIENGFGFGFDISGVKPDWWLQKEKDIKAIQNIKVNSINIIR